MPENSILGPVRSSVLIMHVLKVGIFRHIELLFEKYKYTVKTLLMNDILAQLYVKRYIIRATEPSRDLSTLIMKEDLLALHAFYDGLGIISSTVLPLRYDDILKSQSPIKIIQILFQKMKSLKNKESEKINEDVKTMMKGISLELERFVGKCSFILVGSKCEETQSFYPNEFDFFLNLKQISNINKAHLKGLLEKAVAAFSCKNNSRLILDEFSVQSTKRFLCLHATWIGLNYPDLPISIDIIPVKSYFNDFFKYMRFKTHFYLNRCYYIRSLTFHDFHSSKIIYVSAIENLIIISIPKTIRKGYILAKALRVKSLLMPIFPHLIIIGVTDDIHDIIRTYMLKTCVMFLTHNAKAVTKLCNNRICWTIAIFGLLRYCLLKGALFEYFDYRGLFSCEHVSNDAATERYLCCRKNKARLLIVDRLLNVLRYFRTHMHELNGKGCKSLFIQTRQKTESITCCPDLDYETMRPAPFIEKGYKNDEIEQGYTDIQSLYLNMLDGHDDYE